MRGLSRIDRPGPAGLAVPEDNSDIKILSQHTGELRESGEREDTVATISLGFKIKGPNGSYPQATQKKHDRWIHVSGTDSAPALEAALAAKKNRSLTISFPGDTWGEIVQQHFAAYSTSRLLIYGDSEKLTYIELVPTLNKSGEPMRDKENKIVTEPNHVDVLKSDDPEKYARMLKVCKAMYSVYFLLADWIPMGEGWAPEVETNRLYRLRTNSPHTMDNLAAAIKRLRSQTNGLVRGVPLELGVEFPEVADPSGHKRVIPSFVFRLDPPFRVTDVNFRPMLSQAVETGKRLALPRPDIETIDVEYREAPNQVSEDIDDEDAREVALIARGGPCNAARYERFYFSTVNGTRYAKDDGRAELVSRYTNGETRSLAELLRWSTKEDAERFIAWVKVEVDGPQTDHTSTAPTSGPSGNDEYERMFSEDERTPIVGAPAPQRSAPVSATLPDGQTVDTGTGEIVADTRSTADDEPPDSFADFMELTDILGEVERPASEETVSVADNAQTQDVDKPVPVDVEPVISDAEPIDFDYCVQLYESARRLRVQPLTEPKESWTGDQLRDYALELAPRLTEAERAKEEAKKSRQ